MSQQGLYRRADVRNDLMGVPVDVQENTYAFPFSHLPDTNKCKPSREDRRGIARSWQCADGR
jgi:hypothetical protein